MKNLEKEDLDLSFECGVKICIMHLGLFRFLVNNCILGGLTIKNQINYVEYNSIS